MNSLLSKIKLLTKVLIGREFFSKIDIELDTLRFGSDYGGWEIYPELLNRDSVVYSFGVGEDITFDLELINKYGLTVQAFDPTPRSIVWVKSQKLPNTFHMHEYGVGGSDGLVPFFPPVNPNHVSHSAINQENQAVDSINVKVRCLSSILSDLDHKGIDVLKLDIEGSEYEVISDLVSKDIRPAQILVEFHHRFPNIAIHQSITAIKLLRSAGYRLFSVSASNEEFSFIHRTVFN